MPAKRGRPAKPTALKKLHNAGRRPINDAEPEGPRIDQPASEKSNVVTLGRSVIAVAPPPHVTGIALDKWNELAPTLANQGVLTKWDCDSLARYCNAFKTEVQAQNALEEVQKSNPLNGLLGKTPNGMLQMNALLIVRNAAARDASKFGALLGLDPSSRSSIKPEKPEEDNEWGEFAG